MRNVCVIAGAGLVGVYTTLSLAKPMCELFAPLGAPIIITSVENALTIRYASNGFLATYISFINEIANTCEMFRADVLQVIHRMGYDKRVGHLYLNPGAGFGRPCLEKDLKSLIKAAKNAGYEPLFSKAILAKLAKNEHQINQVILS